MATTLRRAARRLLGDRISVLPFSPQRFEERLVWIVGSPRTGSTWLLYLLAHHQRILPVNEPEFGLHLAPQHPVPSPGLPEEFDLGESTLPEWHGDWRDYFLSREFEHMWRPYLRRLVLARLWVQAELAGANKTDALLAIKEPGSLGADLLLSLLPRSRMIFLLRDPRDVLASLLGAVQGGGSFARGMGVSPDTRLTPEERLRYLRVEAHRWLNRTRDVQGAYARHPEDRKLMVRYEQLRADSHGELGRILAWLDRPAGDEEVDAWLSKLSFEARPDAEKGRGKFARSARPGGWQDDLTAEEQQMVHAMLGPKMEELGYARHGQG